MFTDLALVDWIALAFSAVLLAAAAAAAVVAYLTSTRRSRRSVAPAPMISSSHEPEHSVDRSQHASQLTTVSLRRSTIDNGPDEYTLEAVPTVPQPEPLQVSLEETEAHRGPVTSSIDVHDSAESKVARRAASLRGRPIPESAGAPTSVLDTQLAAARPKSAIAQNAEVNFASVDGFKARTPGFFDDPMGRHELRYWDGHAWTEYVKERGERFTDPL